MRSSQFASVPEPREKWHGNVPSATNARRVCDDFAGTELPAIQCGRRENCGRKNRMVGRDEHEERCEMNWLTDPRAFNGFDGDLIVIGHRLDIGSRPFC